jgi:hypothetical protein
MCSGMEEVNAIKDRLTRQEQTMKQMLDMLDSLVRKNS